jgi:hypothetical protein
MGLFDIDLIGTIGGLHREAQQSGMGAAIGLLGGKSNFDRNIAQFVISNTREGSMPHMASTQTLNKSEKMLSRIARVKAIMKLNPSMDPYEAMRAAIEHE